MPILEKSLKSMTLAFTFQKLDKEDQIKPKIGRKGNQERGAEI